jgi:hypothetical protein
VEDIKVEVFWFQARIKPGWHNEGECVPEILPRQLFEGGVADGLESRRGFEGSHIRRQRPNLCGG